MHAYLQLSVQFPAGKEGNRQSSADPSPTGCSEAPGSSRKSQAPEMAVRLERWVLLFDLGN
jgi:hypothetical protein